MNFKVVYVLLMATDENPYEGKTHVNQNEVVRVHALKADGARIYVHSFLTSAPDGGGWLA